LGECTSVGFSNSFQYQFTVIGFLLLRCGW
jgi:hypothetical protein